MKQGNFTRPLTESEVKIINLLKGLDYLCDQKKLTANIQLPTAGAGYLQQQGFKIFRKRFDEARNLWILTLTVSQYIRYVDFAMEQVGITHLNDGTLLTFDGMFVPSEEVYNDKA